MKLTTGIRRRKDGTLYRKSISLREPPSTAFSNIACFVNGHFLISITAQRHSFFGTILEDFQ